MSIEYNSHVPTFLETKTKPVFKDREKVRLHTEAFLEF